MFDISTEIKQKYYDYKGWSLDIILVLFQWIIKQDYKNKYSVIGDWSQSNFLHKKLKCMSAKMVN